jgi:hypothetical protein|tara:strand:+ start:1926 stop:2105 length:180 start_codon:yes stop_codon:yes gene_type:complete
MIEVTEIYEAPDGTRYVVLSEDLLETLGWSEGDVLDCRLKGNGIVFNKVNEPEKFIPIE